MTNRDTGQTFLTIGPQELVQTPPTRIAVGQFVHSMLVDSHEPEAERIGVVTEINAAAVIVTDFWGHDWPCGADATTVKSDGEIPEFLRDWVRDKRNELSAR